MKDGGSRRAMSNRPIISTLAALAATNRCFCHSRITVLGDCVEGKQLATPLCASTSVGKRSYQLSLSTAHISPAEIF